MSTTPRNRDSQKVSTIGTRFIFPHDHHLVITTPRHVLSYDGDGLHNVFTSGSNGIVAAREARDSHGTLAVADCHNVILHRIEDGLEQSYRLKGAEGQIRLVQFAPDAQTLFFTTTLLNAVQSYSLSEARILEPGPQHESIPTVMGVSQTSTLLLSASETPPLVYLQDRARRTQPLLLQPLASQNPVVIVAFHPDRASVFMLAFMDGTVTYYDANQLYRSIPRGQGHPMVQGGEIQLFRNLHAVTSRSIAKDSDAISPAFINATEASENATVQYIRGRGVTGASFIPGYRSQAVTCGADGRCIVIDFEKNQVLRTWHVHAPASALSLLLSKIGTLPLVTIGRFDGKVAIYNIFGELQSEFGINSFESSRIIDVEWIRGLSPGSLGSVSRIRDPEETYIDLYTDNRTMKSQRMHTDSHNEHTDSEQLSPDTPASQPLELNLPAPATVFHRAFDAVDANKGAQFHAQSYMDLFSPAKPSQLPPAQPAASPRGHITARPRPRLSSSTFTDSRIRSSNISSDQGPQRIEHSRDTEGALTSSDQEAENVNTPKIARNLQMRANEFPSSGLTTEQFFGGKNKYNVTSLNRKKPHISAFCAPNVRQRKASTKMKPLKTRKRLSRMQELPSIETPPKKLIDSNAMVPAAPRQAVERKFHDPCLTAESGDITTGEKVGIRKMVDSKRRPRNLMWPVERTRLGQSPLQHSKAQRPSIRLPIPPPPTTRSQVGFVFRKASRVVTPSDSPDSSRTSSASNQEDIPARNDPAFASTSPASFETLESSTDGNKTSANSPIRPLPPGFAQSYQGPVKVHQYLPRKGSLAWEAWPPASPRRVLGDHDSQQRMFGSAVHEPLDTTCCTCCERLQNEVQRLSNELVALRRIIKGKGRVD